MIRGDKDKAWGPKKIANMGIQVNVVQTCGNPSLLPVTKITAKGL